MTRRLALPAMLLCLVASPAARGQPVGPRFQTNQFVVGNQGGYLSCAYYKRVPQDVASDAVGNFVVVWSNGGSYAGYPSEVVARRYDRFGIPQGDEFQVSVGTARRHRTPSVSMDASGDFVVAWNAYSPEDDTLSDVYARRFGANGAPQGPPFRVSNNAFTVSYGSYSYTLFNYNYILNPDVDRDAAGNFIVVWQRSGNDPTFLGDADDQQILAHRYNAAGVSQGGRFKVSDGGSPTYYLNSQPEVAAHAGGSFEVVWKTLWQANGQTVIGRRFDASGTPLGAEFRVSEGDFFEATPNVETDGSGGFVVVWGSSTLDADATHYHYMDVAARRYDASGTPLAPAFRVNTTTDGYQCGPSLAGLANGNFVVTWHQPFADPPRGGYGQILDGAGAPVGGEFLLDTTGAYVNATAVAPQQNDFVVVWSDGGQNVDSPDGADVFGQRFGTTAAPACSATPLATCRQQTRERSGVLRYAIRSNPSATRLTWVWSKGEATSHAEYGDPFDAASHVFCLYDGSAAPQPLATLVAPVGGFCGGVSCWRQLGGPSGPIQYVANVGNNSGITQIRLKPGGDGAAKITLTARGENLLLPGTALTAPVVMQAQASNGECWTATYDAFIRRNEAGAFVAKPSLP